MPLPISNVNFWKIAVFVMAKFGRKSLAYASNSRLEQVNPDSAFCSSLMSNGST